MDIIDQLESTKKKNLILRPAPELLNLTYADGKWTSPITHHIADAETVL